MKDIRGLAGMAGAPAPAFPCPQGGGVAFTGVCRRRKEKPRHSARCVQGCAGALLYRALSRRTGIHARVQVHAGNVRGFPRLVQVAGGLHG